MTRKRMTLLLLGLILVILPIILFVPKIRVEKASATTWTGLRNPQCVSIGDYDNDGLNDIAVAEFDNWYNPGRVTVYKSDGTTVIKQWTGLWGPVGVAIGDYNNDGLNDIAFSERTTARVTVYRNDGTTLIKQWTGLNAPNGVAIGDYDNDGLNDIAIVEGGAGTITVYKSDGTTIIKQLTGLYNPMVAIGDYNNDGLNDIAIEQQTAGNVTVYESDGTTVIKQWTGLNLPCGMAIGDYDNDGLNDIAIVETGSKTITVYESDGKTIIKQFAVPYNPCGVAIGDYNNDGLNDIGFNMAPSNTEGIMTVYYQTTPRTAARVAEPTIVTLRGTLTNATGYPILSGSMRVTVRDSFGTQVWQDTFDNVIDNGRYNIPLGTKTTLMLIKGQIYNAILEVDANSPTFVSADVIYGDNNPAGDLIKFVAG